jgi:hypothetical protein
VFCCYFYLFHVYFFSYPFGFCYLALLGATLLVLHSMIHFVNVFEMPAFQSGRLTMMHPRLFQHPSSALVAAAGTTLPSATSLSPARAIGVVGGARSRSGSAATRAPPPPPPSSSPATGSAESSALPGLFPDLADSGNASLLLLRPRAQSLHDRPLPSPVGAASRMAVAAVANIHESVEERRARLAAAKQSTGNSGSSGISSLAPIVNPSQWEDTATAVAAAAAADKHRRERSNSDGMVSNWGQYLQSSKQNQSSTFGEIDDDYGLVDVDDDAGATFGLSPEVSASGKHVIRNGSQGFGVSVSTGANGNGNGKQRDSRIPVTFNRNAITLPPIKPTEATPRGDKKYTVFGSFDDMYN